jgi:hypothetical protein
MGGRDYYKGQGMGSHILSSVSVCLYYGVGNKTWTGLGMAWPAFGFITSRFGDSVFYSYTLVVCRMRV